MKMNVQKWHYIHINDFEVEVHLEAEYFSGRPETGPSFSCAGEPAEPPEVNITAVKVLTAKDVYEDITWLIPEEAFEELEQAIFDKVEKDISAAQAYENDY